MKTLKAFAFLAVLTMGVAANASPLRLEGMQNFYYYFGTPCPCATQMMAPVAAPCNTTCAPVMPVCCPEIRGFLDGILF